jgi:hypothetical protein
MKKRKRIEPGTVFNDDGELIGEGLNNVKGLFDVPHQRGRDMRANRGGAEMKKRIAEMEPGDMFIHNGREYTVRTPKTGKCDYVEEIFFEPNGRRYEIYGNAEGRIGADGRMEEVEG